MASKTTRPSRALGLSTKPRVTAAQRRRLKLRQTLWPDVSERMLWDRSSFDGFTTIPRTMPLIMRVIDSLDKKNASRVYFDLWCRAFDDYVVETRDEYEAAFSSGYSGQRAVRSWRERIKILDNFGFIRAKETLFGSYRHILILDPHIVIDKLKKSNLINDEDYNEIQTRLINIGAIK